MSNGTQPLSANQRWKQSGTTLGFIDFMNREKAKMASFTAEQDTAGVNILVNKSLNQAVQDSLASARKDAGYQNRVSGNTILGINKYLLFGSVIVIAAAIGYNIYKKAKK